MVSIIESENYQKEIFKQKNATMFRGGIEEGTIPDLLLVKGRV